MRASSPAQVRPAGPEPMTATLWPFLGAVATLAMPFSAAQSATKRSMRPMDTGSPLIPRTHLPSHWVSWGQTRPEMAGRALASDSSW